LYIAGKSLQPPSAGKCVDTKGGLECLKNTKIACSSPESEHGSFILRGEKCILKASEQRGNRGIFESKNKQQEADKNYKRH
jgi:hypothetical protein